MTKAPFYHRPSWQSLCYASGVFCVIYPLTNAYAKLLDSHVGVANVANLLDTHISFFAPAIITYGLSLPLFVMSFFAINPKHLHTLTHRLILMTLVAGLVFYYFPFKFTFLTDNFDAWGMDWSWAYHILSLLDEPYNQLPSLHVAYALLIGISLYPTAASWHKASCLLLILTCCLIAISTVLTFQHHSYDVLFGIIIALLVYQAERYLSAIHTATIKANIINHLSLAVVWLIIFKTLPSIIHQAPITGIHKILLDMIAYHGCLGFLLVAFSYHRYQNHIPHPLLYFLFNKHQGKFRRYSQCVFIYFYGMYYLMWQLARYGQFLQVSYQTITINQHTDIMAIGRLPNTQINHDFFGQYKHIIWIDMSVELSCPIIHTIKHSQYVYMPMLDVIRYQDCHLAQLTQQCQTIKSMLTANRQKTLLVCQCAMGRSRSIVMMSYLLAYLGHQTPNDIKKLLNRHYPNHRAKPYLNHKLLQRLASPCHTKENHALFS